MTVPGEIRRISSSAEARSGELSDRAIEDGLPAHLTSREIDVLRRMAEGKTNRDIARVLLVSRGTVEFHVESILRKMQASHRADARARYLHLTLNDAPLLETPTLR